MGKSRLTLLLAVLGLAILLPVMGHWTRRSGEYGCALDGQKVDPRFRVRIKDPYQGTQEFCCIRCAELWLEQHKVGTRRVFVTDELSGREIPAETAFFVRNLVVTMKSTGNRIHVFQHKSAAEDNARAFRGTLLLGAERPFANPR